LPGQAPYTLAEIRDSLEREIDDAGPAALARLNERLDDAGAGWNYCPSDPLARRLHHVLADNLLERESAIFGIEHLAPPVGMTRPMSATRGDCSTR
jgi:hypothetical protein